MRKSFEIEDIAERRREQGIDDVELLAVIRGLTVGDRVILTLATTEDDGGGGRLVVQLTSVEGAALRGKVVSGPAGRTRVARGTSLEFSPSHIHSVPGANAAAASRFRTEEPLPATRSTPKQKGVTTQVPPQQPQSVEECLRQIGALAARVEEYVRYILASETLANTSAETKEKAVFEFHERLRLMERHLARVQEDLKLG